MVYIFHFEKNRMSEGKGKKRKKRDFFIRYTSDCIISTLEDFGWLKLKHNFRVIFYGRLTLG